MKNKNTSEVFWRKIENKISENKWVLLFVVIQTNGSTPGRPGFKMMTTEEKDYYGSIGGGKVEYELQKEATSIYNRSKNKPVLLNITTQEPDDTLVEDTMICGGNLTIAAIPLSTHDQSTVNNILAVFKAGKGHIEIDQSGIRFLKDHRSGLNISCEIKDNNHWSYIENVPLTRTIYIIGGGHVGQALARQMNLLDFDIVILDNRDGLMIPDEIKRIASTELVNYENILPHIPEDPYHYVVIVTAGHAFDRQVIHQLVDRQYGYLGMLGSKSKVKHTFQFLKERGVGDHLLEKVKAPIGLPISSQTPPEIAVSIAAEIVLNVKREEG